MDQVDEVKSKVDIVEVVSSYIPLKRAGRNLSGLCPFHAEKTPSFMVSPERQAFKCFGCGVGGDVFTFLEQIEGWDFREALEELAKRAGVKLKDFKSTGASREKEKLIEINKLATKFYKYILESHKLGEPGREYLKKRGIPESLWEKFELGYSPAGWENVSKFLAKKGYQLADVSTAGLIIGRESKVGSGYYDRFRERLIFPIKDSRGTVMGFSGRIIASGEEAPPRSAKQSFEGQAKYINSPQTPIFNKSLLLFGLDLARAAIREKNEAVLVEGEFDVLSSVGAGVTNVVASKGTALTDGQVAILSRLCERVILCFDTDLAGDTASRRGIELLDIAGLAVKVMEIGDLKDPDEFAQKDPAGYRSAIKSARDIYDYFIDSAQRRYDATSSEGKKKIGREIVPILSKISDDIVRAHYISRLAKLLDLDSQFVADAVGKKKGYLEVVSSLPGTGAKVTIAQEEYFLALLVFHDEILEDIVSILAPADFAQEEARRFWIWLRDIIGHSKAKTISVLLKQLPKDLSKFVDGLYLVNVSPDFSERELWANEAVKAAKLIKKMSLKRQMAAISGKLKEAQGKHDEREMEKLLGRFDKVSAELKELLVS